MKRKDGWDLRLEEVFARYRAEPFDWSRHNCVTFASEAVLALTEDRQLSLPVDAFPASAQEAARTLVSLGGLEAAVTSVLGAAVGDWRRCRRGDLALIESQARPILAVCSGRTLCAPGVEGLMHVRLRSALKVWLVG